MAHGCGRIATEHDDVTVRGLIVVPDAGGILDINGMVRFRNNIYVYDQTAPIAVSDLPSWWINNRSLHNNLNLSEHW